MEPLGSRLRLEATKTQLIEGLPWSPLDFIRKISAGGDRAMHVESLLREIDPVNDLRFSHPIAADADVAVFAERLPWDSTFFGYDVARLHGVVPLRGGYSHGADYAPAICALVQLAKSRGIRYLFGAVDTRDLPTIRALTAQTFSLIETRLYFHRRLRDYRYSRRFGIRLATAADVECLTEMARTVENPYDRFYADPFIAREDCARLMDTWIRASVLQGYADATLIPESESPGAVCTVKYHRDKSAAWNMSIAQLVLAIAAPRTDNRLLGLISEVNYHLKDLGFDYAYLSTQISNRSAIRVIEHLGYKFGRGECVFRLIL